MPNGTPYSHSERESIIRYIVDNNRYKHVKGKLLWVEMEKAKVVDRTWQSMNEHFRRRIVYLLHTFKITPQEKIRLQHACGVRGKKHAMVKPKKVEVQKEYDLPDFSDSDSDQTQINNVKKNDIQIDRNVPKTNENEKNSTEEQNISPRYQKLNINKYKKLDLDKTRLSDSDTEIVEENQRKQTIDSETIGEKRKEIIHTNTSDESPLKKIKVIDTSKPSCSKFELYPKIQDESFNEIIPKVIDLSSDDNSEDVSPINVENKSSQNLELSVDVISVKSQDLPVSDIDLLKDANYTPDLTLIEECVSDTKNSVSSKNNMQIYEREDKALCVNVNGVEHVYTTKELHNNIPDAQIINFDDYIYFYTQLQIQNESLNYCQSYAERLNNEISSTDYISEKRTINYDENIINQQFSSMVLKFTQDIAYKITKKFCLQFKNQPNKEIESENSNISDRLSVNIRNKDSYDSLDFESIHKENMEAMQFSKQKEIEKRQDDEILNIGTIQLENTVSKGKENIEGTQFLNQKEIDKRPNEEILNIERKRIENTESISKKNIERTQFLEQKEIEKQQNEETLNIETQQKENTKLILKKKIEAMQVLKQKEIEKQPNEETLNIETIQKENTESISQESIESVNAAEIINTVNQNDTNINKNDKKKSNINKISPRITRSLLKQKKLRTSPRVYIEKVRIIEQISKKRLSNLPKPIIKTYKLENSDPLVPKNMENITKNDENCTETQNSESNSKGDSNGIKNLNNNTVEQNKTFREQRNTLLNDTEKIGEDILTEKCSKSKDELEIASQQNILDLSQNLDNSESPEIKCSQFLYSESNSKEDNLGAVLETQVNLDQNDKFSSSNSTADDIYFSLG